MRLKIWLIIGLVIGLSVMVLAAIPTHNNPVLNSTLSNNLTSGNLTCWNMSTADATVGHTVYNKINWYKNNNSLLLLNLPFDINNTNGKIVDYSPYSINGTNYGGWFNMTDCMIGNCYTFNKTSSSYIELTQTDKYEFLPGINGKKTWIAWFKTNVSDGTEDKHILFQNGDCRGVDIYIQSQYESKIFAVLSTTAVGISCDSVQDFYVESRYNNYTDNRWHMVALVADRANNNLTLYIDGLNDVSSLVNESINLNSTFGGEFRVGTDWNAGIGTFDGNIDEVRVINGTITGNQIKDIYDYERTYHQQFNTIVSKELSLNDIWSCSIQPTDNATYGILKYSNNITLADNTLPTISGVSPLTGTDDTPTFTFNTNEIATCKYDDTGNDRSYDNMLGSNACSGWGTSHTCGPTDSQAGGNKTYYFACVDAYGNNHTASNNYEHGYYYNSPPTITDITYNVTLINRTQSVLIRCIVTDAETANQSIVVNISYSKDGSTFININSTYDTTNKNWKANLTAGSEDNWLTNLDFICNASDGTLTSGLQENNQVNVLNNNPLFSAVSNDTVNEDSGRLTLSVYNNVSDTEDAKSVLKITAQKLSGTTTSLAYASNESVPYLTFGFDLDANESGTDVWNLTVYDSEGNSTSQQYKIVVNSINDIPFFNPLTNSTVNEDSGNIALDVTSYISDVEDADSSLNLTAQKLTSGNTSLVSVVNSTSIITFSLAANGTGFDIWNLTVYDTNGSYISQQYKITITTVNDNPWLQSTKVFQNITKNEDTGTFTAITSAEINGNFSDVEDNNNPNKAVLSQSSTSAVSCSIVTGALSCNTVANQSGQNIIILNLSDSGGLSVLASINVSINSVNDAPWIDQYNITNGTTVNTNVNISLFENGTYIPAVNIQDVENEAHWYSWFLDGVLQSLTTNNYWSWIIGLTSANNYVNLTVEVNDSANNIVSHSWNITIRDIITGPTQANTIPNNSTSEDTGLLNNAYNLSYYFQDEDNVSTQLIYAVHSQSNPSVINCVIDGIYLDCTTVANQSGTSTIIINATDGVSYGQLNSFVYTVTSVNDQPWMTSTLGFRNMSINEDTGTFTAITSAEINGNFSDVEDNNNPNKAVLSQSSTSAVSCSIVTGALSCNTVANSYGQNIVTLNLSDSSGLYILMDINVSVTSVNDLPTVAFANVTPMNPVDDDNLVCENGTTTDADGEGITLVYIWYNNSLPINVPTSSRILNSSNTSAGETWYCGIKPFDGTANGTEIFSSTRTIDSGNTAPLMLTSIIYHNGFNSTILNPANNLSTSQINITAQITDPDANTFRIYVCKSADATTAGCGVGGQYCNSTGTTSLNQSCIYNTTAETNGSHTVYIYAYDGTDLSGYQTNYFYINSYPIISDETIDEMGALLGTSINLQYTFNDTNDNEDKCFANYSSGNSNEFYGVIFGTFYSSEDLCVLAYTPNATGDFYLYPQGNDTFNWKTTGVTKRGVILNKTETLEITLGSYYNVGYNITAINTANISNSGSMNVTNVEGTINTPSGWIASSSDSFSISSLKSLNSTLKTLDVRRVPIIEKDTYSLIHPSATAYNYTITLNCSYEGINGTEIRYLIPKSRLISWSSATSKIAHLNGSVNDIAMDETTVDGVNYVRIIIDVNHTSDGSSIHYGLNPFSLYYYWTADSSSGPGGKSDNDGIKSLNESCTNDAECASGICDYYNYLNSTDKICLSSTQLCGNNYCNKLRGETSDTCNDCTVPSLIQQNKVSFKEGAPLWLAISVGVAFTGIWINSFLKKRNYKLFKRKKVRS